MRRPGSSGTSINVFHSQSSGSTASLQELWEMLADVVPSPQLCRREQHRVGCFPAYRVAGASTRGSALELCPIGSQLFSV